MNNYPPGMAEYMHNQDESEARQTLIGEVTEELTDSYLSSAGRFLDLFVGNEGEPVEFMSRREHLCEYLVAAAADHKTRGALYSLLHELSRSIAEHNAEQVADARIAAANREAEYERGASREGGAL